MFSPSTSSFTYCQVEGASKRKIRGHYALEEDLGAGDFVMVLSVPLE